MLVIPFDMAIYSLRRTRPDQGWLIAILASDPERGKTPSVAHNEGALALPSPGSTNRALQAMGYTTPQISRI
jgi:hypothetical protein